MWAERGVTIRMRVSKRTVRVRRNAWEAMTLRVGGEEVMGRDCDEKLGELKRKCGPFIGARNVRTGRTPRWLRRSTRPGRACCGGAAATAARQAVQLAQLDHNSVVEAPAAAEAGQARQVDDHSPLGWRIRSWAVEARIAERVRNDPSASLDAQRSAATLHRAAGRAAAQLLKDPSPWLGRSGSALLLRVAGWAGGPRGAVCPPAHRAVRHAREGGLSARRPMDSDSCRGARGVAVWQRGCPLGAHDR
jgi:hypothetical protein